MGKYLYSSWQNSGVLDGDYLKIAPTAASSNIVLNIGALSVAKKIHCDLVLKALQV